MNHPLDKILIFLKDQPISKFFSKDEILEAFPDSSSRFLDKLMSQSFKLGVLANHCSDECTPISLNTPVNNKVLSNSTTTSVKEAINPSRFVKHNKDLASFVYEHKENDVIPLLEIDQYLDASWQLSALMRTGNLEYLGNQEFRVRIQLDLEDLKPLRQMGRILSERL